MDPNISLDGTRRESSDCLLPLPIHKTNTFRNDGFHFDNKRAFSWICSSRNVAFMHISFLYRSDLLHYVYKRALLVTASYCLHLCFDLSTTLSLGKGSFLMFSDSILQYVILSSMRKSEC